MNSASPQAATAVTSRYSPPASRVAEWNTTLRETWMPSCQSGMRAAVTATSGTTSAQANPRAPHAAGSVWPFTSASPCKTRSKAAIDAIARHRYLTDQRCSSDALR